MAVRHALAAVGGTLDDIVVACSNNHHHRVAPYEARLPWNVDLGLYPATALEPDNLLPTVPRYELSHHLAHVWSAIAQAPFERGLVVVMDGMGERSAAFDEAEAAGEDAYMHDLRLKKHAAFKQVPPELRLLGSLGHREGESAYTFDGFRLQRLFKRWVEHRSPPELYNHGFADLESLGALYSRVSSHIYGDWNACGKVMGLGPWASRWASEEQRRTPSLLRGGRLEGNGGEALRFDWTAIESLPHANGFRTLMQEAGDSFMEEGEEGLESHLWEQRGMYAALAERVQSDLEDAALSFLSRLQRESGEVNLCLVGGVIQNSVLNGRVAREAGFEQLFIPPYPSDEGIAAGCAAYAQQVLLPQHAVTPPARRGGPWGAYQGRPYSPAEVQAALEEFAPWLVEVSVDANEAPLASTSGDGAATKPGLAPLVEGGAKVGVDCSEAVIAYAASALAQGEILAWCHGRAEVGARALGHRSILANPTLPTTHRRVNTVKQREQFRPLAPSVLAEEATSWFDGVPSSGSPYMQLTASVRPDKRESVPGITHVDGSARLQTVHRDDAPLYHALIAAFCALVGVPMVLNTSCNLAGMPIVESPADAIACFLDADPDLSLLVLFGHVLRRRPFPEGDAAARATPQQQRSFVSRCVSDPTGQPLRAEVLVEGAWISLALLDLEVLERCADGEASIGEISEELTAESEGELGGADVDESMRRLYKLRLIAFD